MRDAQDGHGFAAIVEANYGKGWTIFTTRDKARRRAGATVTFWTKLGSLYSRKVFGPEPGSLWSMGDWHRRRGRYEEVPEQRLRFGFAEATGRFRHESGGKGCGCPRQSCVR